MQKNDGKSMIEILFNSIEHLQNICHNPFAMFKQHSNFPTILSYLLHVVQHITIERLTLLQEQLLFYLKLFCQLQYT